ncbi:1-(5-phosphoribosyl)-5-[(5-phosphoribosylamino)methylideneamino]imidazole-4-carboxamide isomerase [bacterium SCSIO 12741]|nr:1-(5-phosphoribosyl)-5-[(5-phosphoribosylamino)methylideneamino]imidazole-4-carboxamide isomerase [bacterium SCSIO 12741]
MRIIPAIDIINGKCVRLSQGDYQTQKVYHEDPLEVAKQFEASGIQYLHLVDLDGARAKRLINHSVLEKICTQTELHVDFGGGVQSHQDIQMAFECGAQQVTAGSIAVKNPLLFLDWINQYGKDKIILGADCHNRRIATHGWLENSDWEVVDFIQQYKHQGVEYVICTDIEKDGMLAGSSFELYQEIIEKTQVKLIASGGVSSLSDLKQLKEMGCEGAIIGKAIYEGNITLKELETLC